MPRPKDAKYVGSARVVDQNGRHLVAHVWSTAVSFVPLIELDDGAALELVDQSTLRSAETGEIFRLFGEPADLTKPEIGTDPRKVREKRPERAPANLPKPLK